MRKNLWVGICTSVLAAQVALPAFANEEMQGQSVDVELNAKTESANGCLLSFVVQNGHAATISRAVYEAVLFDSEGQVKQLTLFDFGELPPARPRVRQFVVPNLACDTLSLVIINGAATCEGEDLPHNACEADLTLRTRVDTEFQG